MTPTPRQQVFRSIDQTPTADIHAKFKPFTKVGGSNPPPGAGKKKAHPKPKPFAAATEDPEDITPDQALRAWKMLSTKCADGTMIGTADLEAIETAVGDLDPTTP